MALKYLLDTNICIYIAKSRPPEVVQRFNQCKIGELGISLATYGELLYGANKSQQREQALSTIEQLSRILVIVPLQTDVGIQYGQIRATLEKNGTPIGNNDLWIAAQALSLGVTLITNNMREFQRIPHLSLENWVAAHH